jgi:hypothetical protein
VLPGLSLFLSGALMLPAAIEDLQTEMLQNPLGLQEARPRFS